jgi:small subunit ribosomal protein S1
VSEEPSNIEPSRAESSGVATETVAAETPAVEPSSAVESAPAESAPPSEPRAPAESSSPAEPAATDGSRAAGAAAGSNGVKKPKSAGGPKRQREQRNASLFRAFRSGRAVEGRVERVIKGGYEIRIGRARGFCPHSQMDIHRIAEPESFTGQSLLFRITQVRRGGEDVVVSRRAILEEDRLEEAKAVRATLIEGAKLSGTVAGLADFGAFVDLGAGVMGLVHVSELSHHRVTKVNEAVKVGDVVPVRILKLDEVRGRISLSIRQAQEDPWSTAAERFTSGSVYPGLVRRLTGFGAFVELEPGIEALAPGSEFPPAVKSWRDGLDVGSSRDWLVLSVDAAQRRISITPAPEGGAPVDLGPIEVGRTFKGEVQRIERFGVFVWLGPGRVGLMLKQGAGLPPDTDLQRRFTIGEELEVEVAGIEEGGRKIRLNRKGVQPAPPPVKRAKPPRKRDAAASRPRSSGSKRPDADGKEVPPVFGTSLADKLRAALGQVDRP